MLTVLMGKSTSGKDTVKNILVEKYGFKPLITYTTRPMRKGEKQDETYHFITDDDFEQKIDDKFFIEWQKYQVGDNIWYYGTSLEDVLNADDRTIVILTPDGIRRLQVRNIDMFVIYLYANLKTIKARLSKRKDLNDKIQDRINRDIILFKDADVLANKIVYNNLIDDIDDVMGKILGYLNIDSNMTE